MNDKEKQYKVESALASGAFGKVFLVTDKESEKVYALKVLTKSQVCVFIERKINFFFFYLNFYNTNFR